MRSENVEPELSIERIVPDTIDEEDRFALASLQLHRNRYQFARMQARPGNLLDIACGVGYGSHLLAEAPEISEVHGVDCSVQAIDYARSRYVHPKVRFSCADAYQYLRESTEYFDTIVSLETIEHLPDPVAYLRLCTTRLALNGVMICSVPISPTIDINPYHLTDFTSTALARLLLDQGLMITNKLEQRQETTLKELREAKSSRTLKPKGSLLRFYLRHPSSAMRRLSSLCCDGFDTRYVTVVAERPK